MSHLLIPLHTFLSFCTVSLCYICFLSILPALVSLLRFQDQTSQLWCSLYKSDILQMAEPLFIPTALTHEELLHMLCVLLLASVCSCLVQDIGLRAHLLNPLTFLHDDHSWFYVSHLCHRCVDWDGIWFTEVYFCDAWEQISPKLLTFP